jgi:hypothetical protein
MNHVDREAPGPSTREPKTRAKNDVSDRQVVVLGSGNLGLIYLMEEKWRLSLEEIEERHPRLVRRARAAPSALRPCAACSSAAARAATADGRSGPCCALLSAKHHDSVDDVHAEGEDGE